MSVFALGLGLKQQGSAALYTKRRQNESTEKIALTMEAMVLQRQPCHDSCLFSFAVQLHFQSAEANGHKGDGLEHQSAYGSARKAAAARGMSSMAPLAMHT